MSRWEHRSIPDQYMFAIAPLLIYIGGGVRGRFWMQEQRVGVGRVACRDRTSELVQFSLEISRDCKPVKGLSIQAEIGKKSMRLEWGILGSLLEA